MLIIIDKRLPAQVKKRLSGYGEVIEFFTSGITYDAISGHPDIFFCQMPGALVVAPNTPSEYLSVLYKNRISYTPGTLPVGNRYPHSAHYNAVVTEKHLIHNLKITDQVIKTLSGHQSHSNDNPSNNNPIHDPLSPNPKHLSLNFCLLSLSQGYTRCNLIHLKEDKFITSDQGIFKALQQHNLEACYVSPDNILLPGQKHGFFGGCCGVWDNKLFIAGSLDKLENHVEVREFVSGTGFEIIELYEGSLYDGGSILFINE